MPTIRVDSRSIAPSQHKARMAARKAEYHQRVEDYMSSRPHLMPKRPLPPTNFHGELRR